MSKHCVALDESVAEALERAAELDGVSLSSWLTTAALRQLKLQDALRGIAEWQADASALTPAERAAGEMLLDRLLGDVPA